MSLSEAILAIADDIEGGADEFDASFKLLLKSYAKQLRVAVKASAGSEKQSVNPLMFDGISAEAQHRSMIEKAGQEFRTKREGQLFLTKHEESEPRMVLVLDGPLQGTSVPVDVKAPIGCTVVVDAITFTLTEEGLKSRD